MASPSTASTAGSIDRRECVRRHDPLVRAFDPFAALTVGNGEFAFTADVTGLQTFIDECRDDFPLCTGSNWAWHTTPAPPGISPLDYKYKSFDTYGRQVGYATSSKGQETLFNWMRENPHRLHLGRIGFEFKTASGAPVKPSDLRGIEQRLDLWAGMIDSRFDFDGKPVRVQTCCHPTLDLLAVRVESPLLADGRLGVLVAFPYGSPEVDMADWKSVERHHTTADLNDRSASLRRTVDADQYAVRLTWSDGSIKKRTEHEYVIGTPSGSAMEFTAWFSAASQSEAAPGFAQVAASAAAHWQQFWTEGGAIDLAASSDSRAQELERRIVLSQYNTALHCAGSLPPQETGLLFNSWYGKSHLEMHWWHGAHFTAWNRFPLLEKSLGFYERILPVARENAHRQGYEGARWTKMVGPDGHDSPSPVAPLLIWQQPHPIYYAELCYRHEPTKQTLERWREIVFESADFMATFAVLDKQRGQYVLGPPLKTVSENTDATTTKNSSFELAYWRFGLRIAQQWRERMGMQRERLWDTVLSGLSPLPVENGLYLMQEGMSDTYTKWNWEHPALLGVLGVQPGDGVDPQTMHRTVQKVFEVWDWDRAWGWDFPMAAMAAARVGEPELAVRALLIDSPKNRYHPNGHNYQRPKLTAYLPGNGGFLAATASMAAGWTAGPNTPAPGFPTDGKWSVKSDRITPWL